MQKIGDDKKMWDIKRKQRNAITLDLKKNKSWTVLIEYEFTQGMQLFPYMCKKNSLI